MFLTGTVVAEPPSREPSNEEKKAEKKRLGELAEKKQPPPRPAFSRRAQLVDVALRHDESRLLARAIVNRIWHRMMGHGLVMPLDQMHSENEPSHPELLAWLTRDMMQHGYDLRRLIRGLVLSQTYARSSRWESGDRPRPSDFAVAAARPLTPRQYASSLHVAATSRRAFTAAMNSREMDEKILQIEKKAAALAQKLDQPGTNFQISFAEALLLSNNEQIMQQLLPLTQGSLVHELSKIEQTEELVEEAVWNVLCRPPESDEVQLIGKFLEQRHDRKEQALQQIVWSLLTSSENRFNY